MELRPATPADTTALYDAFRDAVDDLLVRLGRRALADRPDVAERAQAWEAKYGSLFRHLEATAESCWVAERDGRVVGYARSTMRDGLRELTELFVTPDAQSRGLGARLLEQVFPTAGASQRMILATVDPRALARYLGLGLSVRDVVLELGRAPRADARPIVDDRLLEFEPIDAGAPDADLIEAMGTLDAELFGHRRDVDLRWLAGQRDGFVARRGDTVVGYGFVGATASGPVAALRPADMPSLLAHAERAAAAAGHASVWFHLPATNTAGIDHLLRGGFQLDPFQIYLLSERPFRGLDRYAISGPTFFL